MTGDRYSQSEGRTPLHQSVCHALRGEIVGVLLDKGLKMSLFVPVPMVTWSQLVLAAASNEPVCSVIRNKHAFFLP